MSKKSSVYKAVFALLLAVTLGSSVAYAKSSVCPDGSDLSSGKLNGWQIKTHHSTSPVLTQVQLSANGDLGCEYVQKTASGHYESFVVKKVATSTDFPIDFVKESGWSDVKHGLSVCTPSSVNACEFIDLKVQSVATASDPVCDQLKERGAQLAQLIKDETDPAKRAEYAMEREAVKRAYSQRCMQP